MSVNIDNNKNEAVKEFLSDLLKKFKLDEEITLRRKKIFEKYNILHQLTQKLFRLGLIESGINIIEKIQFKSVDNFDSVKRLKKAELFFSEPYYLKRFKFLNDFKFSYCTSQIDSAFLTCVDIEIQLDELSKKAENLFYRGFRSAGVIAKGVVSDLEDLNRWCCEKKIIDYRDYKIRALAIIENARPILDQHQEFKHLLADIILLILVIPPIVNKVVNGHFLFFQKPNCSEQLNKLNQMVSQLSL